MRADSGAAGLQGAVRNAGNKAVAHSPGHGLPCVWRHVPAVKIGAEVSGAGGCYTLRFGEAVDHGCHLLTVHSPFSIGAVGYAGVDRPCPGLGHAGGIRPGQTGQCHPHLLAVGPGIGAEGAVGIAAHNAGVPGPCNGRGEGAVAGNVGEGAGGRAGCAGRAGNTGNADDTGHPGHAVDCVLNIRVTQGGIVTGTGGADDRGAGIGRVAGSGAAAG